MPQGTQRKLMPYLSWTGSKPPEMLSAVTSKETSDCASAAIPSFSQ
jgi:hypothetical protein